MLGSFLAALAWSIQIFYKHKAVCCAGVHSKMCVICSPGTPCGLQIQCLIFPVVHIDCGRHKIKWMAFVKEKALRLFFLVAAFSVVFSKNLLNKADLLN